MKTISRLVALRLLSHLGQPMLACRVPRAATPGAVVRSVRGKLDARSLPRRAVDSFTLASLAGPC